MFNLLSVYIEEESNIMASQKMSIASQEAINNKTFTTRSLERFVTLDALRHPGSILLSKGMLKNHTGQVALWNLTIRGIPFLFSINNLLPFINASLSYFFWASPTMCGGVHQRAVKYLSYNLDTQTAHNFFYPRPL